MIQRFWYTWENWWMHQDWVKNPSTFIGVWQIDGHPYIECQGAHEERQILIEAIDNWIWARE